MDQCIHLDGMSIFYGVMEFHKFLQNVNPEKDAFQLSHGNVFKIPGYQGLYGAECGAERSAEFTSVDQAGARSGTNSKNFWSVSDFPLQSGTDFFFGKKKDFQKKIFFFK